MTYKSLLKTLLTSFCSLGAIATVAVAQEPPECYIVDASGELTDLTDICNASQKKSSSTQNNTGEALTITNNNSNVVNSNQTADSSSSVLVGDDLLVESSSIDSSYYIDSEPGINYAAYTRRYNTPSTSAVRQSVRERAFQFNTNRDSLTSILRESQSRLPFIIYRYPKY